MADIYRSDIVPVDLNKPLSRKHVGSVLATGDNGANRFGASVLRDGLPVDLTGYGVTAYFMRPGQNAVILNGRTDGNAAFVDLAQACYTMQSSFTLTIKVSGNGITTALRVIDGYIILTQTDELYAPPETVPTWDDIFAQIAAMEQVTAQTRAATADAVQATEEAQAATQEMMTTSAPPIIPTATGEVVTITDSAERPLAGLRLYGKTTQDGVPTPSAPVPLVNAGDGGSIGVKAADRNYMPVLTVSNIDRHGISWVNNGNGSWTANGTATDAAYIGNGGMAFDLGVLPAGEYELVVVTSKTDTGIVYIRIGSGENSAFVTSNDNQSKDKRCTFTADGATPYWAAIAIKAGKAVNNYRVFPVLTSANGGSVTASTPNGLPGIPVTSGGNYTDVSGQQWICDEIDYGRGGHVKNCLVEDDLVFLLYDANKSIYYADTSFADASNVGMCNMYERFDINVAEMPDKSWRKGVGSHVYVRDTAYTTVDAFNAAMRGKLEILGALATPIETPLSADELAAYRAMTSHKPNTTVYNDAGAGMAVDYIADTKNYIDQRIAALLNV